MTRCQTLARIAGTLARQRGWSTLVSDSQSTESSYLYIGQPSRKGGFETVGVLRVAYHRIPGYGRGGWQRYGTGGAWRYDMRPKGRKTDRQTINHFLSRFEGQR